MKRSHGHSSGDRRNRSRSPPARRDWEGRPNRRAGSGHRGPSSPGAERRPGRSRPEAAFGGKQDDRGKPVAKEMPSMALSGKLLEDTNTYKGVLIKYSEPPEAQKPKRRYRLYAFKGDETLPVLYIHRQSGYLIGRDHKVCDLPMDHPSISKQHAALQYRQVQFERPNGKKGQTVKPYIIDLESANGTYLNNQQIESSRYVELREKDVIKFGYSSREYVLLAEDAA